jgi:hypothetical protein
MAHGAGDAQSMNRAVKQAALQACPEPARAHGALLRPLLKPHARRGARTPGDLEEPDAELASLARQAAKAAWAKLIHKVYEVDSLPVRSVARRMRVITLMKIRP